jgi:hypothetical protein
VIRVRKGKTGSPDLIEPGQGDFLKFLLGQFPGGFFTESAGAFFEKHPAPGFDAPHQGV